MKFHWGYVGLVLLAILAASCSCGQEEPKPEEPKDTLTKKAAKSATHMALDMVEGVSEALEERGEQLGEKVAGATGEVIAGAAEGSRNVMEERGEEIGENLSEAAAALEKGTQKSPAKPADQNPQPD